MRICANVKCKVCHQEYFRHVGQAKCCFGGMGTVFKPDERDQRHSQESRCGMSIPHQQYGTSTALFAVALISSGVFAGTLKDVEEKVDKTILQLRIDREKALKPARNQFLKNLEVEMKQWQAGGKLDLLLAAEGRKEELNTTLQTPFEPAAPTFAEENPIAGSKAEEQYKQTKKLIYQTFAARLLQLDLILKELEPIQKSLTQKGKTFEALEVSEKGSLLKDKVDDVKVDFSSDPIVYDRWYRREQSYDFVLFTKKGRCLQTYGPQISGESDYAYKLEGDTVTVIRTGPSRPTNLVLKIRNIRTFEDGWRLSSLSEYLKAKEEK